MRITSPEALDLPPVTIELTVLEAKQLVGWARSVERQPIPGSIWYEFFLVAGQLIERGF